MTANLPPGHPPHGRSNRRSPPKPARQSSEPSEQISRLSYAAANLAESEARYRLLAETSTDGIIVIDQNDRIVFVNQATGHIFGYQPDDLIGQDLRVLIPPDLRERHMAGLRNYIQTGERHLNWRGNELPGLRKDGTIIPLEIAFGESRHGDEHLFFGYARDISERKHVEHRLAIQYAVTRIIAEANSLDEATPEILKVICENLGWVWGALWEVDERANVLWCSRIWHRPDETLQDFDAISLDATMPVGVGLPGRVWQSGEPAWLPDANGDSNFPRRRAADRDGLHGCFAFPVINRGKVLAVMEFFSREIQQPDQALLDTMAALGRQFGLFLVRQQAEQERTALLREIDDERVWLRTVIERSPIGILLVEGAHGERVSANARAEKLFGHPLQPEGGIHQYVGQIHLPNGTPRPPEDLAVTRALRGQVVLGDEEILRHPDGTEVRVLVSGVPIRTDGQITGAVVVYEDITRIRELERLREESTSVIAHDLRQPVGVITGYGSLLRRRIEKTVDERDRAALDHILTAARNLNKMIEDLLDISRIEAGRLELDKQPTDIPALVRAVVARLAPITAGHAVQVQVEGQIPTVEVDPTRIEQLLGNLLSNAVKYGFPKTPVQVRIALADAGVLVSVTNEGPGIPPADIHRLFTRFYRTETARELPVQGLGLGLYISKGIVDAHQGRIWVDSVVGGTTTFRFLLPFARNLAREIPEANRL